MSTSSPRVAIVTGAAGGIGLAVARRLAEQGCAVAIADLDQAASDAAAEQVRSLGVAALGVAIDVADEDSVAAGVARIADELGAPTILVNNAGITRDNLLFKMTVADWDSVSNVHLRGAFLMSRAAQKYMVDEKFGRIINLSSISALGNRGQANYAAAKAGLQGFTRTLALELGKFGVTANAVAPGFIETAMTIATAERMGVSFDDFKAQMASANAVGRTGEPDDIAHAVAFFADERSSYITGQVLYVSGTVSG